METEITSPYLFTAEQARKNTNKINNNDAIAMKILSEIQDYSLIGASMIEYPYMIISCIKDILVDRGFTVIIDSGKTIIKW